MMHPGSLHACTTATRAQLPSARVLCASLRTHHPGAELTVLLLDGADESGSSENWDVQVVSPRDLGVPPDLLGRLAMVCTATEFADALTPRLVRFLLEQGAPAVIALSADTEVFAPLHDVVELAVEEGVVLAPRVDAPVPDDGLEPNPAQVAVVGPFASEFVAVGGDCAPFLDWWCDRQLDGAFERGSERSGPWTALVPVMFPFNLLRDPGCAASAWNLHARELRTTDDGYEVSGAPLRWFDFGGYSPEAPHLLSTDFERPRIRLSDHPALAQLCDEHAARLQDAGYDGSPPVYGYGALPDGNEIDTRMRRMYVDALRDAAERGDPELPSPFGREGAEAFVAWINEPVAPPVDPRVSRYLAHVWQENDALQQAFPSLAGEGGEEYVGSLRVTGRALDIPDWALPTEEHLLELIKRRWRARPTGPRPRGVNVVGYVTAIVGLGHVARVLASMLDDAGVSKAVVANRETISEKSLAFNTRFASDAPYDVNLLCVNADHTAFLARQLGPEFFAGRRTIGVWFWEVEDFPSSLITAFDFVDEVWVASDFVLESIAPVAPKPVRKFPLPVVVPSARADVTRAQLGLPDGRFVFLFGYDFLSAPGRKNPVGLIEAYRRAFEHDDGTALVLKSINGEQIVGELERVRKAAAGRPDIIVLDGYMSPERHRALLAHCDAYVSLHRSEGFGLDMAAAMGLGKPVIATGYSGNLEFMNDTTSYLVDFDLEPVGPGNEPYPPDSRWACPRLDHAAELMRRVVEHPEEARELGRRAAARIRTDFSLDARSGALARMVDDARARPAREGSWRHFFAEAWRAHHHRVEDMPAGALYWLPDGVPVDPTIRRLLTPSEGSAAPPDPELNLPGFYRWLNERVFPPQSPVVSRYLYNLWCDRPDLQSHFPNLDPDPRGYLEWLVEHGHADTDIAYQLLPTHDDLVRLTRYQEQQARRAKLARVLRSAGQRAAGLVNRR